MLAEPVPTDWCGVASAGDNVALLWRDRDRLSLAMCTSKRCSSLPAGFKVDRKVPVIGFGCLRNACLVATRDASGLARLALLTETSKTQWRRTIETAVSPISIIGIGDGSFVAGYKTAARAEVVRFDRKGAMTSIWRDDAATTAPVLAWSSARLLVAYQRGEELVHEVVRVSP
jgi:hypothetical protein